ncbi:MAG: hypothetical protein U0802_26770 [Candidatus Binatia bacterium]
MLDPTMDEELRITVIATGFRRRRVEGAAPSNVIDLSHRRPVVARPLEATTQRGLPMGASDIGIPAFLRRQSSGG